MVIDYDKYPILKMLDRNFTIANSKGFKIFSIDSKRKSCIDTVGWCYGNWCAIKERCNSRIDLLTSTFVKAMQKSAKSFNKIDVDSFLKGNQNSGCLIFGIEAYLYLIEDNKISIIYFERNTICAFIERGIKSEYLYENFATKNISEIYPDTSSFTQSIYDFVIVYLIFKKYAKIEYELCKCGKKTKSAIVKDTIKNKSSFNVNVMDCTWFTTIFRNEGFKVRGHFRLQPKIVNGGWTKELIYINEYEKKGYHRMAKIEHHKNDS